MSFAAEYFPEQDQNSFPIGRHLPVYISALIPLSSVRESLMNPLIILDTN